MTSTGQRIGEFGHQVELRAHRQRLEQVLHQLVDGVCQALYRFGCEGAHHQVAQARVVGRIAKDHPPSHRLGQRPVAQVAAQQISHVAATERRVGSARCTSA